MSNFEIDRTVKRQKLGFTIYTFFSSWSLDLAIWNLYFTENHHLSLSIATTIHMMLAFSVALSDLPTSTLADFFGRRVTAGFGLFFRILGALLTANGSTVTIFIIASIITGLGSALASGTTEALLYDNLKSIKQESAYDSVFRNSVGLMFLARCVSFVLSGYLFSLSPTSPYYCMALFLVIAGTGLLFMGEYAYSVSENRKALRHVAEANRALFSNREILTPLLFLVLASLVSNQAWYFYQPLLTSTGASPVYIGGVYAFGAFTSYLGTKLLGWLQAKEWTFTIYLICALITVVTLFGFGVSSSWYIIALHIGIVGIAAGMTWSVQSGLINRAVYSEVRATSLSVMSSYKSLIMALMGIGCAYIAEQIGIQTLLLILWFLFIVIASPLLLRLYRMEKIPS